MLVSIPQPLDVDAIPDYAIDNLAEVLNKIYAERFAKKFEEYQNQLKGVNLDES